MMKCISTVHNVVHSVNVFIYEKNCNNITARYTAALLCSVLRFCIFGVLNIDFGHLISKVVFDLNFKLPQKLRAIHRLIVTHDGLRKPRVLQYAWVGVYLYREKTRPQQEGKL